MIISQTVSNILKKSIVVDDTSAMRMEIYNKLTLYK